MKNLFVIAIIFAMLVMVGNGQTFSTKEESFKVNTLTASVGQVTKQVIEFPTKRSLTLSNPTVEIADVDFVAFDSEGKEIGKETVTLDAGQTENIEFRKVFPELKVENLSSVEVQATVRENSYEQNALQLNVNFFSQRDSRWKNNRMGTCTGTGSTIGEIGCAITSVAMSGAARVSNFNPASLNTYLNNNGGYSGCSVVWSVAANIDGNGGFIYYNTGTVGSASSLKSLIDAGKFSVVKSTRFSTHWAVIIGYRNNGSNLSDFYYLDPWDTSATFRYIGDGWVGSSSVTRIYN